jgi:hypothetical protein
MNKPIGVALIIIIAVVVGGMLFLYGGDAFTKPPQLSWQTQNQNSGGNFTVLSRGQHAFSIDQQVNYRITDESQFETLWVMTHTTSGPTLPKIDFSKKEVLAIYGGSHSTGGYDVTITSIEDTGGKRVITVRYTEPGDACVVSDTATNPYILVVTNKSPLPLEHKKVFETNHCR